MRLIWNWIISAVSLLIVAWLFPKISIDTVGAAFVAALVLGLVNAVIRPILQVLALPITLITFGIFALVINAAMLLVTSSFVAGFHVETFASAFFGSIVLSIVSAILGAVKQD
ncbi:phage holin family protein [Tumebacillus permanentifrigoris]|uniref:Putative membrane protein n=1 Tax=Tumebacillus permanentifrigoris TaxID=378543 RepID=A0A316D9I1_9BACL|nr:phage holin family protein [Tumebacillus permanentifrigoris]PWK12998.1 putative membrane protein [Tumebacillus permanentifrigoris]